MHTIIAQPQHAQDLSQLASLCWNAAYPGIISQAQIDYMLAMMYQPSKIEEEIRHKGITWLIASETPTLATNWHDWLGYASFGPHPTEAQVFRLHKLYLHPAHKGVGLGAWLLATIKGMLPSDTQFLELNVNKQNAAYRFYLRQGFTVHREEVLDIGAGYVMDDYVMRLALGV